MPGLPLQGRYHVWYPQFIDETTLLMRERSVVWTESHLFRVCYISSWAPPTRPVETSSKSDHLIFPRAHQSIVNMLPENSRRNYMFTVMTEKMGSDAPATAKGQQPLSKKYIFNYIFSRNKIKVGEEASSFWDKIQLSIVLIKLTVFSRVL